MVGIRAWNLLQTCSCQSSRVLPLLVPLPELVQADEVGVEDRHVAPVDRDGLLGDEDAVGVFRKSGSVALDQILDGLSRRTFDLKPGSQGLLLSTNFSFYVSTDMCLKAPSNVAINRLKKLVEAHFFDFPESRLHGTVLRLQKPRFIPILT